MEKHLVTIEFRYDDADEFDVRYKSRTVTIGVYDDFDEACKEGNKVLENLESKFELHKFPQGHYAPKERFSKNGGCFGGKKNLITNLAYLKTPFDFYAKITTLKYNIIDDVIIEACEAADRYRKYKNNE